MRSFTLNGAMNAGPENEADPEGTGFTLPTGGRVVERPSTWAEGIDLNKMKGYWETGKKIYDAGGSDGSDFPYGEALEGAASGALAGSAIPGVGTVLGGIIGGVIVAVKFFCGPRPSAWDAAAPGVHDWFTTYGQQAFLDWLGGSQQAAGFQSVDAAVRAQLMYWLQTYSYVVVPGERFYNNIPDDAYIGQVGGMAVVRQIYTDMGIDYDATRDLRNGTGGVMYLKRDFIPAPGAPGDDDTDTGNGAGDGSFSTGEKVAIGIGVVGLGALLLKSA